MNRRDLLRAAPALPLLPLLGKVGASAGDGYGGALARFLAITPASVGTLGVDVAADGMTFGTLASGHNVVVGNVVSGSLSACHDPNATLAGMERDRAALAELGLRTRPSLGPSDDFEWLPWGSPLAENTIVPGQYPRCGEKVRDTSKIRQADEDW
jgi:hypothetical protein